MVAGEDMPVAAPLNIMRLIQTGVLAVVALILGLFVVRPILTSNRPSPKLLDNSGGGVVGTSTQADETIIDGVATPAQLQTPVSQGSAVTDAFDDPIDRLRGLIEDRRDEAIQVLQGWIDEPDAKQIK